MNASERYTEGEVAFLLSLKDVHLPDASGAERIITGHEQALDLSVQWIDSVGAADADKLPSATSEEWDPVLLIARWREVHDTAQRIVVDKERVAILELRLVEDLDEREVAQQLGLSQPTVHRRFRATLAEILLALGGPADPFEDRTSRVSACMKCATRPRARWQERTMKVAGRKHLVAERQASLCRECIPEDRRAELVPPRSAAA